MIKLPVFNLFLLLYSFAVVGSADGRNVTKDVFGSVAVQSRSEEKLYNDSVEVFTFMYMPSIAGPVYNTPYCSVSSVIVRGLNCDDSNQSSQNYIMVVDGVGYDNREQGGRFLSCSASRQGRNLYKLTLLHVSPMSSIQHRMLVDMGEVYSPGTIVEYTGVNNYYSSSTGKYESEAYVPIEGDTENPGYSNIPLNCRNFLAPAIP